MFNNKYIIFIMVFEHHDRQSNAFTWFLAGSISYRSFQGFLYKAPFKSGLTAIACVFPLRTSCVSPTNAISLSSGQQLHTLNSSAAAPFACLEMGALLLRVRRSWGEETAVASSPKSGSEEAVAEQEQRAARGVGLEEVRFFFARLSFVHPPHSLPAVTFCC